VIESVHPESGWLMPESYDTAMPQDWFDLVIAKTGTSPYGHIVWSYDSFIGGSTNIFGLPYPTDEIGLEILQRLAAGIRP
jgi:hypothetical protein